MKKNLSLTILSACFLMGLCSAQSYALANPASIKCTEDGGQLTIKTDTTSGQYGECIFPNGSVCEERAYFCGTCSSTNSTGTLITVTLAPAKEYCVITSPSECFVMTVSGSNETILIDHDITGFNFKKGNTYVLNLLEQKLKNNNDNTDASYTLVKEVSRTFDAQVCSNKRYNDGCNNCTLGKDGQSSCTKMMCVRAGIPSCAYDKSLTNPPTVCTMEYDPVCNASGSIVYGNSCMARAAGLNLNEYSRNYCKDYTESMLTPLQRAFSHHITMFDTEKKFQGNNPVTSGQAAKMLSVFAILYTNNTISTQSSVRSCSFWDIKNIDSDGVSAITQSCTLGLFQGYKKSFMPSKFLTNEQARIVIVKIIPNTNSAMTIINLFFEGQDMKQAITRAGLIRLMQELYIEKL